MKENQNYKTYFKEYAVSMIVRSVLSSIMFTADKLIAGVFIGAQALVATTIVSPLMFLIAGISFLFIGGLGAYVGLLIGRDQADKANHTASGILVIMTILGLVLMLPAIMYSKELTGFLGARDEIFYLSENYLRVFALAIPLLLTGKGLDVLILNDGSPRYSFVLNMVGSVANVVLNILAVAVFDMGIAGLALATVISSGIQLIGGGLYFVWKPKIIHLTNPSFEWRSMGRICYNGISDFAMMIVESVMVYIINLTFVRFLSPQHFEAYASASIIFTLFYGIHMGATMGLQPVLSQMMGRGDFDDLKQILFYSVKRTA